MSFAQEMKDFVAGYQAVSDVGQKKRASELDEKKINADIDYQNAKLDLDKQELALKERSAAARAKLSGTPKPSEVRAQATFEHNQKVWAEKDAEAQRQKDEDAAVEAATAEASALPTSGIYKPVAAHADGGIVGSPLETSPRPKPRPSAIPEEAPVTSEGNQQAAPAKPAPAPAPTSAIPTEAPTATAAPAAEKPEEKKAPEATKIILEPAKEALNAVTKTFITKMGEPRAAVHGGGAADSGGAGQDLALPLHDYDTIMKTVDPEGKLPPHMQTAAAISAVWRTVKDPEKRFKLSSGVLGSALQQSQIIGSLVPAALESGDANAVCRLMNDACNKYPSGHEIIMTPIDQGYSYKVKDESGKVIMSGNLTPEEMMTMSGQVADGSMFLQQAYKDYVTNQATGGSYSAALDNVTAAYTSSSAATDAYKELAASDATYEEKQAAYDKAMAARKGLDAAEADARRLGVQGKKPLTDRQISSDLRSSRRVDAALPDLAAPEKPAPEEPGIMSRLFGGSSGDSAPAAQSAQGGKPAPSAVMESAKAALAKGADRAAVIKRLTDNGYSAEGL